MAYEFGRTLLIINPAAQNGAAAAIGETAEGLLRAAVPNMDVAHTTGSENAAELGAGAGGYDTVIALGGDGVIHHVAQGLMRIPAAERPVFGIIPVGSGNDYSRTVHMPVGVEKSVAALLAAEPRAMDVMRVNDVYCLETLSFGLDAAIALGTMERRKRTGETGIKLYFMTGCDQVLHHLYDYQFHAVLNGEEVVEGDMKLFAVQNGKTYGGGFLITPDADATDGFADICYAKGQIGTLKTLVTFAKAMNGKHTKSKFVRFHKASRLTLNFAGSEFAPPCQIDGEPLPAESYDIEILPRELKVLCGTE